MQDNRDDYEPIIATRPRKSDESRRDDAKPLWPMVLALTGALVAALVIAWWFMGRSVNEGASAKPQSEGPSSEFGPEIQVEDEPPPPARDVEPAPEVQPGPTSTPSQSEPVDQTAQQPSAPSVPQAESSAEVGEPDVPGVVPDVIPEGAVRPPVSPTSVAVRFASADAQVRFELRGPLDSSNPIRGKVGEVLNLAPGTYRVVASGPQLEDFEQRIVVDGDGELEYSVELCAERKRERENLAGRVVEERACASAAQCESMFLVLGEEADQLVKDRAFRDRQCANWRADAVPEGAWTLDTKCDGATAASTCRIEIAAGSCVFAEPARSARGAQCPRAELKRSE